MILKPLIILMFYITTGLINSTMFYEAGVHDCSNMAVEQVTALEHLGFEPVIYTGVFTDRDKTEIGHAWYSVCGLEINPTSFLPLKFHELLGYKKIVVNERSKEELYSGYFLEGEFDLRFEYYWKCLL